MWKFRILADGEPERHPHESEFFKDMDVAASLVREAIQNALDARNVEGQSVCVRFIFGDHPIKSNDAYYEDLIPHLTSCTPLPQFEHNDDKMAFLTIEDFGTKGLDGPVTRAEVTNEKGNYLNFWWSEGKSEKHGQSRGRWGLGKTIFHVASGVRSFFGLTVRSDDQRKLLLGKSLLTAHKHTDGKQYNYFGYFTGEDGKPIEDNNFLTDFVTQFRITRTTETGLSIVIPGLVEGIKPDGVIRSAIIHYFFPIITKMLTVEIWYNSKIVKLNSETIYDIANEQNWQGSDWENMAINPLMMFLLESSTKPAAEKICLKQPSRTLKIGEDSFEKTLEDARKLYSENKVLWIDVPIKILPAEGPEQMTHFEVFIQKDDSLREPDEFYIRSGITISDIKMIGSRHVRALLSAHDGPISTFLGDSESPAHTEWKERTEGFSKKYINARDTLRYVRSSMRELVKILEHLPPGLEPDFLQDIFFIPRNIETPPPPPPPPPAQPRVFDIRKISGGFSITLADASAKLPLISTMKLAYDTKRGNPFSRYNPLDFDLAERPIQKQLTGGNITRCSGNSLEVEIMDSDFVAHVTGFDEKRDLVIVIK